MIRADVKSCVGQYQRIEGRQNHRNGSYGRECTLKGIGAVAVKVPRDRNGQFKTQVIPRSKRYESVLREDLCTVFLGGISTRTLSLLSEKLIGRRLYANEVSRSEPAVEQDGRGLEAARSIHGADQVHVRGWHLVLDAHCRIDR